MVSRGRGPCCKKKKYLVTFLMFCSFGPTTQVSPIENLFFFLHSTILLCADIAAPQPTFSYYC
jgi:hypothetical protein